MCSLLLIMRVLLCVSFIVFCATSSFASGFGNVRGIVHDPQRRPIVGASVRLSARLSDFSETVQTNADGEFSFRELPIGQYLLRIESAGFSPLEQPVTVVTDSAPILQLQMIIT